MVPPTSGSASISGYNIVTETEQARRSLGLCPQHNVLFPDLTVAEHIILYSSLKGMSKCKIDVEVDHFVKLLDLEEKVCKFFFACRMYYTNFNCYILTVLLKNSCL